MIAQLVSGGCFAMRMPLVSVKPKKRVHPQVEVLEPRCTPVATVVQFGNNIVINADPAGGSIDVFDNGTSNVGAIQVFSSGQPVFALGFGVNPLLPIQVGIFGSNKNDTVSYNLIGNLTPSMAHVLGGPGDRSGGRVIAADLGKGSTDSFQFTWPPMLNAGYPDGFSSGVMWQSTFQLNVVDHAKTENLSVGLGVLARSANLFVNLTGDKGIDNLTIREAVIDGAGTFFAPTVFPTVNNTATVSAANGQKKSQLVDRPVLTPGIGPGGVQLADPNQCLVFGNNKTTATVLTPFVTPGTVVLVFGIPQKNITYM
jgi:hypothetical protein